MGNIKAAIEYLKTNKIDAKEAINVLSQSRLDQSEKNLVYCYCYPRPLPDYGLPDRIQEYRASHMIGENGNDSEVAFLLEACQTEQYGRFMKHIMHAFGDASNVHPVQGYTIEGKETDTCCICGKELHEHASWSLNFPSDTDRHFLCFGSTDSSSVICIDCLIRLVRTIEIINEVDPGFLDWTKRGSYQEALNKVHPI